MKFINKFILIVLLISCTGCAAMMNHNKPDLRDDRAIASAYHYGVIERYNRYVYGNILLILPIMPGFFGYDYDETHNNYWVVVDKEKYQLWKKSYLEFLRKEDKEVFGKSYH